VRHVYAFGTACLLLFREQVVVDLSVAPKHRWDDGKRFQTTARFLGFLENTTLNRHLRPTSNWKSLTIFIPIHRNYLASSVPETPFPSFSSPRRESENSNSGTPAVQGKFPASPSSPRPYQRAS